MSSYMSSFSQFPSFWGDLTDDQNDLLQAKSVLTVLGFTTKSSISTIKSKKLIQLESEYAKMRSNKPAEMFTRFPALRELDFFSPGLKEIILDLADKFNSKPKDDLEKKIRSSVLRQAKKVCNINRNVIRKVQSILV